MQDETQYQHNFNSPDNGVGRHKMCADIKSSATVVVKDKRIDRSMDYKEADQEQAG